MNQTASEQATERGGDVLLEICVERSRQDAKWGGPSHDDTHSDRNWESYIHSRVSDAGQPDFRKRMIEIAALAVAAVESYGRKAKLAAVDAKLAEVKGDVITGPGEYEVVRSDGSFAVGEVVRVEVASENIRNMPWVARSKKDESYIYMGSDGLSTSGNNRVRKHVPAPEPAPAPQLEEEIGEGLWWAVSLSDGDRVKVHLTKAAIGSRFLAEFEHCSTASEVQPDGTISLFDDSMIPEGCRLVRRVKQPTVRPYTLEEAEALVVRRALIRRKSDRRGVVSINFAAIDEEGVLRVGAYTRGGAIDMDTLLADHLHLDGSPCGVTEGADPWDTPTGD